MYDPVQFAEIAIRIAEEKNYDPESRSRTALGRAYYALFLATRAAIRRAQGRDIDEKIRKHGDLTNVLFDSGDDELIALGTTLQDLYEYRRRADYVLAPDESWRARISKPTTASMKAKTAKKAIEMIRSLDFSPVVDKNI